MNALMLERSHSVIKNLCVGVGSKTEMLPERCSPINRIFMNEKKSKEDL
jgi:hypothetical protein